MKIKIIGIDDSLILKEFAVVNQGFFDTWEFVDCEADLEFNPHLSTVKNKTSRNDKYDYLRRYLTFLEQEFNQQQAWGLLNGMRPNKLIHSMKKRHFTDMEIFTKIQERYLVRDEKINLLLNVANHQLKVIPDLYQLEKEVSIYIGIPFCPTKCTYCTFAAYAYEPHKKWVEPFLTSLLNEIEIIGDYLNANNIRVTSIYLGGGTPTMLNVQDIESTLQSISKYIIRRNPVREITVEAGRPDTLTKQKLELLKAFNVNRISINPQSFNQETLDQIGRYHSVAEVIDKFKLAKKVGLENVNMDLIVGLPNEEKEELSQSLAQIKKWQPESLTVHMLALKRKSEIAHDNKRSAVAQKNVLIEMAKMTYDFAEQEGYIPYYLYRQKSISGNMENIGYAKSGYECLYNIVMMEEAQTVLGLGVGASSKFLIGESVHNPKDLRTYIEGYEHYAKKKLELLELSIKMKAQSFTYHPPVSINTHLKYGI